jgi:hypothetical protein
MPTSSTQKSSGDFAVNGRVPQPKEMHQLLVELLKSWASCRCESLGSPGETPLGLSLEIMIRFNGPFGGCLVVRGSEGLTEVIAAGHPPLPPFSGGHFVELARLYFERLAGEYWKSIQARLKVDTPQVSDPNLWPGAKPQSALAVLVEDKIIEVRLWLF